jgi:hypothetical protein
MAEQVQSYKKHARWLPAYHFFVMPVLLANVVNAIRHVYLTPVLGMFFQLVVAVALLMLGFLARVMALTVQDRVIRLEMRLRLRGILPTELHPRINELTPRQLVAMRFASDEEMADMMRDVLNGKLATSNEIKQRVKNWQADWLRA